MRKRGPRVQSAKPNAEKHEARLKWGGRQAAFRAWLLAFVRIKRRALTDGDLTLPVLEGRKGSPAYTLAGILTADDVEHFPWVKSFCGVDAITGRKGKGDEKCQPTLRAWFRVSGYKPAKHEQAGITSAQQGQSTDKPPTTVSFDSINFPAARIVIRRMANESRREANLDELWEIERQLAALRDWDDQWRTQELKKLAAAQSPRKAPGGLAAGQVSLPPDDELLRAFSAYLVSVARDCSELVTRGIPLPGDLRNPLRLAHVYAQLETTTPRRPEPGGPGEMSQVEGPFTALEALFDPANPRVVLVGEPGSGKSTLLQYATLCLADRLARGNAASPHLAGVPIPEVLQRQSLLPLRIILRDFAARLAPGATAGSEEVVAYLAGQLQQGSHAGALAVLTDTLKRGLAFVQFDGLDEVPKSAVAAVRSAITAFAAGEYQRCRLAVTCRTESYKLAEFSLAKFPAPHQLAPLTPALRNTFVQAWYRELESAHPQFRGEGAACAASLLRALGTERLDEMSRNPFFLTAMAALHRPDKPLPDTGAKLMDDLVTGVLEECRLRRGSGSSQAGSTELGALLANVPDGFQRLRQRLEAIAFKARDTRQDHDSRRLDEDLLRQKLRLAKTVDDDWIDRVLGALRHRAGLLQSKDGRNFEFAYRFEEFLAGCFLANDDPWPEEPSFVRRCATLLARQGDYARQVLLWAAGFLVHVRGRQGPVRDLVSLFTPEKVGADESSLARLELAADLARDARMEHWQHDDVPDAPVTISRLRTTLEIVRDDPAHFGIGARSRAGSSIGRLGDTRPGVGLDKNGLPRYVWCGRGGEQALDQPLVFQRAFPAKTFLMGGDPEAWNSSKTPFECTRIEHPFFLSKYPVTVAQYQVFVDQGGYGEPDLAAAKPPWWTDAGWAWRNGKASVHHDWKEWYARQTFPILRPEDYGAVFQTPNHPRGGVSWHEAVAFCRWLTERLRQAALPGWPATAQVRLPTDPEWELAARWNKERGAVDGRVFPWGNPAEGEKAEDNLSARCNWQRTGLDHTSPVGLFPDGGADCGAMDLAGNAWEWCQSKWVGLDGRPAQDDYNRGRKEAKDLDGDEGNESEKRVLRGGSWGGTIPSRLRCAYRGRGCPSGRSRSNGFRCVVVWLGSARG